MTWMSPPTPQPLRLDLGFGEQTPATLAPDWFSAPALTLERQLWSSRCSDRGSITTNGLHRNQPSHVLGWRVETRVRACQIARVASRQVLQSGRRPKSSVRDLRPMTRAPIARDTNGCLGARAGASSFAGASVTERGRARTVYVRPGCHAEWLALLVGVPGVSEATIRNALGQCHSADA